MIWGLRLRSEESLRGCTWGTPLGADPPQRYSKRPPTLTAGRATPLRPIPGQAPKPGSIGAGAPFRSRCPVAVTGLCERSAPGWTVAEAGHEVACHRFAREGRAGLP